MFGKNRTKFVCIYIKDTKRFPKGDVERILKAMIKSLENKHLNP